MGFGAVAGIIVAGLLGLTVAYYAAPDQVNALFGNETKIPDSPKVSAPEIIQNEKPSAKVGFDARIIERQIFDLTNSERIKAGLAPVEWNDRLWQAGLYHVEDMAANNYFEHNSLDGRTPNDRARAEGYYCSQAPYYGVAENIYSIEGIKTFTNEGIAQDAVSSWMNSEGHRANMLTKSHFDLGVAVAFDSSTSIVYIAQEFC